MSNQNDAAFLARTKLFAGLDLEALGGIAASATPRLIRTKQALFLQGGEATHLYLVTDGLVKIGQVTGNGAVLTLRFMDSAMCLAASPCSAASHFQQQQPRLWTPESSLGPCRGLVNCWNSIQELQPTPST